MADIILYPNAPGRPEPRLTTDPLAEMASPAQQLGECLTLLRATMGRIIDITGKEAARAHVQFEFRAAARKR